jgi:hypothetical protein
MRASEVERYKLENEARPDLWRMFGVDLVDAGSPNPCSRSGNARKVLGGRWQEAMEEWLQQGEFSRPIEEIYLGWILATEAIFHRRPSAAIPMPLPKRIWSDAEYRKSLRHYQDIDYRNKTIGRLLEPGTTPWGRERMEIGALIKANKPEEAERLYYAKEWDQNDMAEDKLALIHTCAYAEVESPNYDANWFFAVGNRRGGPVRFDQLKTAFIQGKLLGNCLIWREGMPTWQKAADVKCFASVVYTGALPPPLPVKG